MPAARPPKPRKPYPDFPLFPHASGRWAKKIRGKLVYFGKWEDPDAAVAKYLAERDHLHAGRPVPRSGGLTVGELCNRFLTAKRHLVDTRELSSRTFADYLATCKRVAGHFGRERSVEDLRPEDFDGLRAALARGRGPVTLANDVRHVRILFKFADDADLIARPLKLKTFKAPGRQTIRKARQVAQRSAGLRMFEAAELRSIVEAAEPQLRAMILLGINAGFGQTDVASLPRSAVDLADGWIDFPRPKTAVHRRVPLWPETRDALAVASAVRPKPKDPADEPLVFLTRQGRPWVRTGLLGGEGGERLHKVDSVGLMFGRLLTAHGLKRPGLGFYALRHTFRTVADETRDQPAVGSVMGHDDNSMASLYRERIGDERLRGVTDHVRAWLFG